MHKSIPALTLAAAIAAITNASAASIDPSLIPDGTYTVKIEKVVDNKHIQVTLENGAQTTLAAGRDAIDFANIKPSDQVKLSLLKGNVMVFLDLTRLNSRVP